MVQEAHIMTPRLLITVLLVLYFIIAVLVFWEMGRLIFRS